MPVADCTPLAGRDDHLLHGEEVRSGVAGMRSAGDLGLRVQQADLKFHAQRLDLSDFSMRSTASAIRSSGVVSDSRTKPSPAGP